MLDFWDDFSADGLLAERDAAGADAPVASLAGRQEIPAGETAETLFLLTWHFPNRMTWNPPKPNAEESCCDDGDPERIGNYYTTRYKDAWEVAEQVMVALPELEENHGPFCAELLRQRSVIRRQRGRPVQSGAPAHADLLSHRGWSLFRF